MKKFTKAIAAFCAMAMIFGTFSASVFAEEIEPQTEPTVEAAEENAPIYNVAGQRLDKARKGINIIGDKKVLVK